MLASSHEMTKLDELTQMQGGHMLSWSQQSRGRTKGHCDALNSTFTSLNTKTDRLTVLRTMIRNHNGVLCDTSVLNVRYLEPGFLIGGFRVSGVLPIHHSAMTCKLEHT